MKLDLEATLRALGLPIGLVALYAAILGLFGVSLEIILHIIKGLAGTSALVALAINVLKWAGALNDGSAGKWSAMANLGVLVTITVVFKLYPQFDFSSVDAQIAEFTRVAGIVFAYIVQLVGSRQVHKALAYGLNIKGFSNRPVLISITGNA